VTNLALRQNRVRRFLHGLAVTVSHLPSTRQTANTLKIRAGKDADNAGHVCGGAGVNAIDLSVRYIRAQKIHISLTVNIDVVGIITGSG
jgi:hypothetical protein